MNILFVHQNFPGQFRHVALALGRDPAQRVVLVPFTGAAASA